MTIQHIQSHLSKRYLVRILQASFLLMSLWIASPASAQITIGGNVYGGGNKGAMTSTATDAASVTIKAGKIDGKVFGGARQAGIAGGTHVLLDGANASDSIIIGEVYGGNDVSGTVSGAALVESSAQGTNTNRIYVTNLYGGGNGDYDYASAKVQKEDAAGNKLYTQADGSEGTTVTENPVMVETNDFAGLTSPEIATTAVKILSGCYNQVFAGGNSATVTGSASITLNNSTTILKDATGSSLNYQFDRVFGGNNKVAMAIRPTWHLEKASINNLYSGGNAGDMTHENGILLAVTGDDMVINNVYGGCRMANVNPDKRTIGSEPIEGVQFNAGYAARTLITGGKITNVYGGNDISGNVYGGCALEIRSSILGDVYGGGNGSYPYSNKQEWQTAHPEESDYFYTGTLYDHRPNAESVYMHVMGTETKPTYIGGSLYCGGNSATLTGSKNDNAQLKIGSYVIADKVFLGSNGENMVTPTMLAAMKERNTFDLTQSADMEEYMRGVNVEIKPAVNFDGDYKDYSTKFGSLYCGGNVGSMSAEGQFTISFLNSLVIYDKIVGGCNNANVAYKENVNAFHMGGLTKAMTNDDPKVQLNISGVKLEPRYLEKTVNAQTGVTTFSLKWNKDANDASLLKGANIYGGCYASGYVNGKAEINVTADAISENVFKTTGDDLSGASYEKMRDNPLVSTMSVYGGGYGKETEIWGDVAVNIKNDAHILKVYGGGELGFVGKMKRDTEGNHQKDTEGNLLTDTEGAKGTVVTLNATLPSGTGFAALNAAKIYGGGFQGDVTGNTHVNLNQGRVYNAFGGACNADIYGAAEMIVGVSSVPEVTNNIYGANDFGGQIKGYLEQKAKYTSAQYQTVRTNAYLEYYDAKVGTFNDGTLVSGGNVFGGPCGSYDYTLYAGKYHSQPTLLTPIDRGASDYAANSFVNVIANDYNNKVSNIFGAGQGVAGSMGNADMNNSYVLLHARPAATSLLADNIYGAGDCSLTTYSLVDAYTGQYGTIFGGCHGVSLSEDIHQNNVATLTYMGELSEVNLWNGMTNKLMDVYGGGAYSGTKESKVTLKGGYARDIYGASYNEGITYLATVEIPVESRAHVNAIFGGGKGQSSTYPCDTYTSFINYSSTNASVESAVYGGNNQYRITRFSHLNINAPVKNEVGDLKDVYGAGYGENTVAQYTNVHLNAGSKVRNVFGGGSNGRVLDMPSVAKYMESDYFGSMKAYASTDKEIIDYTTWYDNGHHTINGETIYALTAQPNNITNTRVNIPTGALVANNAYGGGEGSKATVSGTTGIDLVGGTVTADLYGGGLGGNVAAITDVTTTASTNVRIQGGNARNVYGGGLEGHVEGDVNTVVGTLDQAEPTFANGLPTIERSLYGGGEKGHVSGRANLTINNGYVGYKYVNGSYVANVDYKTDGDDILVENGNAFGGGYGEGAYVLNTNVEVYDGIIRNGLYGGGEIAAVGRGEVVKDANGKPTSNYTFDKDKAGETHIYMYGGHVRGDVFGGGRGFSYDMSGNEVIGKVLNSDGYVFGTTDVNIRGGEVGTEDNIADGHGNVFGGGNIGYVYSVNGTKYSGSDTDKTEGYYYDASGKLTEDTRVIVSPWTKVTAEEGITINGHSYAKNAYVPTEDLNYLKNKNNDSIQWARLDISGVNIRNAVFAGGNVSSGSDKMYANAVTVYGNATATLNDVYFRDLITVGTEHTGGLYGEGNLTFVDGYRELNVTNYGTDYYGMSDNITLDEYKALTDRERAYFELKYKCLDRHSYTPEGSSTAVTYEQNESITQEEYNMMTDAEKTHWVEAGFCSIYAGRLLNTIQRADFVGVFGSRMVLQGARDRVPSIVDYTNYTINRVGEVSLNKRQYYDFSSDPTNTDYTHGNYFGMYNVVNFLGALTSDVDFDDVRTTENGKYLPDSEVSNQSFYQWKEKYYLERKRNIGSCHNKVALASGVYLELVHEPEDRNSTTTEKDYGLITGVIELDLINVMTGLGGGYVYAKNEHGVRTSNGSTFHPNLSTYNESAINQYRYSYSPDNLLDYETSGNFIHDLKQIVDECYPYSGDLSSPAHYWFIKGQIYVYDQYISAYTGSAQAYEESLQLPLTLNAGANGRINLLDIKPQYYAYWYDGETKLGTSKDSEKVEVNLKTYELNDIITYWEYMQLSQADKGHFVENTYVNVQDYLASATATDTIYAGTKVYLPTEFEGIKDTQVYDMTKEQMVSLSTMYRPSNSLSHDKGYALTVSMDNPGPWDAYYTKQEDGGSGLTKILSPAYKALTDAERKNYADAPTYRATAGGVYGQRTYGEGDLVNGSIYTAYQSLPSPSITALNNVEATKQAVVERAYAAEAEAEYIYRGVTKTTQPGVAVSTTEYQNTGGEKSKFDLAVICTSTLEYGKDKYVFNGEIITERQLTEIATELATSKKTADAVKQELMEYNFEKAYICTAEGLYGGQYFEAGKNYSALSSWANLTAADRQNFTFNYDALDVILHDNYPATGKAGSVYPYDYSGELGSGTSVYSKEEAVDYEAKFVGWKDGETEHKEFEYDGTTYKTTDTKVWTRQEYEALPNEQKNFAPIVVADEYIVNKAFSGYKVNQIITKAEYEALDESLKSFVTTPAQNYYIVKVAFSRGEVPYVIGQTISSDVYNSLDENLKKNVDVKARSIFKTEGTYYYCRNSNYKAGTAFTTMSDASISVDTYVELGTMINSTEYNKLPNYQKGFAIYGKSPIETSRLFVSRESDIKDLTKDRVITLVYQYDYDESDASMTHIEKISERHILNIHVSFKSGVPEVGQLQDPKVVLPGSTIGLRQPSVKPGAYEIIGGGWETYTNQHDAEHHTNGASYINNATPMYWYQNGYWVAYYTKTYLGKTYSNPVQFRVANYHDMADVIADTQNSMYIGHTDVDRAPKIYISSDTLTINGTQTSELDMFKDLYDRTLTTKVVQVQTRDDNNNPLFYVDNNGTQGTETTTNVTDFPVLHDETVYAYANVKGGANLDFFLTDDVAPTKYTTGWTPIGTGQHKDPNNVDTDNPCFGGNFHGDGNTITGLNNSLFAKLCGNVYNLGVTGSFTGAGIADAGEGWVENCWMSTSGTPVANTRPVFAYSTEDSKTHMNNNYYLAKTSYADNTGAKAMPEKAFYNGEVAYDLNGFYLYKRYADQKEKSGTEHAYSYFVWDNTGAALDTIPKTSNYQSGVYYNETTLGYVEHRYADGDFVYADGTIPEEDNERLCAEDSKYYPIWPDDYLYFGQMLTYGYVEGENYEYQNKPSHIYKTDDKHLFQTDRSNRVFRTPAYFMNKTMDKAYFNYKAVFAKESTEETGSKVAYPNLTAIDFTANGDKGYEKEWLAAAENANAECFYPPFLDYDGLKSYQSSGLTQNLLVYGDPTGDADSYELLADYLAEPAISQGDYNTVRIANTNNVHGHLVDKSGTSYVASRHHLLVDKQNFNCPISYTFSSKKYMWYQRTPERFANGTDGWETICLPFSADLVSTQNKGEITHFYGESKANAVGHEYWLRGLQGVETADGVTTAAFIRPMAGTTSNVVNNSFLYDYYYSKSNADDKNQDDYQKYWNSERTYDDYPYYAEKTPYIISFPGKTFYEFDMSGEFEAQNTYAAIPKLEKQTVSFISSDNQVIAVSDDEARTTTVNGYKFRGFYQADAFSANEYYALNAEGSSFAKGTTATQAVPFRAYFRTTDANVKAETIFIGPDADYIDDPNANQFDGTIQIYGMNGQLHIVSYMGEDATVPVYTPAGQLIQNVQLRAGAHVRLNLPSGIYMAHGKKAAVR